MQRDKILKNSLIIKKMLNRGVKISKQLKILGIEKSIRPQSYTKIVKDFLANDYKKFINHNACNRSYKKVKELLPIYRNDTKSLYNRLVEDEELIIQKEKVVSYENFKKWVLNEFK